jgi:hypothetical protein
MKHRVRFVPALINSLVQIVPLTVVLFLVFLAALAYKGVPMDSQAWQVLFAIFGGAIVFVSLGMAISSLADWFAVEPTGLSYRVSHGVGSAQLIMKKAYQTKWEDILEVNASRYMPFKCLYIRLRRDEVRPIGNTLTLPLYLREQEAFARAVLTHAPGGQPIRAAFESGFDRRDV